MDDGRAARFSLIMTNCQNQFYRATFFVFAGGNALAGLIREEPPGLVECRASLSALVAEVQSILGGLPLSKIVLSGFSQVSSLPRTIIV